ncbi:MAG: hypothetical protein ACLP51_13855 [Syntrophobacteraceae bacterium]
MKLKGGMDLARQAAWKAKNVSASLLGGAAPGVGLFAGKVAFGSLVPVVAETGGRIINGDKETDAPSYRDITSVQTFIRKDDFLKYDVCEMLDGEGLAELQAHANKLAVKKEKGKKGKEGAANVSADTDSDMESEKVISRQMPYALEYFVKGLDFKHRVDLFDPADIEIGALYRIYELFSQRPYIGGCASKGFGLVAMNYTLFERIDNGEPKEIGSIRILEDEKTGFMVFHKTDSLGAYDKYMEYLTGLTRDDIDLPKMPKE